MKELEIYDCFLEKNIKKTENEKINLKFVSSDKNEKEFKKEFNRFLHFTTTLRVREGSFVNFRERKGSVLGILSDDEVNYVCELFKKSEDIENQIFIQSISEFILTYYYSLLKDETNAKSELNNLENKFQKKAFYKGGKLYENAIKFYKKILEYSCKNKMEITSNNINRILKKFSNKDRLTIDYKHIFDKIMKNGKFLNIIVEYDYDLENYFPIYDNYVVNNINSIYSQNDVIKIIKCLDNNNIYNESNVKGMLNKYIDIVNNVSTDLKKEKNLIRDIDFIDRLLNISDEIKQLKIVTKNGKFKNKISECNRKILFLKRSLISDKEYINKSMNVFSQQFSIPEPKKPIDQWLQEDIVYTYYFFKINFDDMLKTSSEIYSEATILNMTSKVLIDNEQGTYEFEKTAIKSTKFSEYYSRNGNNYENMIRYINSINDFKLDYYLNYLYSEFDLFLDKVKSEIGCNKQLYNNQYVLLCRMIILIEYKIFEIEKNLELDESESVERKLESIFNHYKNDDDSRNGCMFVYYCLYENKGLDLRDKIMHGNILNRKNYCREIVLVFSCLIFTVWLGEDTKNKQVI